MMPNTMHITLVDIVMVCTLLLIYGDMHVHLDSDAHATASDATKRPRQRVAAKSRLLVPPRPGVGSELNNLLSSMTNDVVA